MADSGYHTDSDFDSDFPPREVDGSDHNKYKLTMRFSVAGRSSLYIGVKGPGGRARMK